MIVITALKEKRLMGMIIQFASGLRVEALLLAASSDEMRIIVSKGNTLELVRVGDSWHTASGVAIEIEALLPIPGTDVTQFCSALYPRALGTGSSYPIC
jgi:hypothetical protein